MLFRSGALDLKLRKEMQLELKRLQREMNITFVYVTHDQEEALILMATDKSDIACLKGQLKRVQHIIGYTSIHYFSRQFKKITGMTPSEYASSVKAVADGSFEEN